MGRLTAIEELLAAEEKGAVQAAAKKQRQKAKKQQQQQQQQQHLEEEQQQLDQKGEQQQQQEPLQQQGQQSERAGKGHHDPGQRSEAQHKNTCDKPSVITGALAELQMAAAPAMAQRDTPAGSSAPGSAAGNLGRLTGAAPLQGPSASAEAPDGFLQGLFCCPLTKVVASRMLWCLMCCKCSTAA